MPIKNSKKISSRLLSNGRTTFIYSNTDYKWNMLPDGTLLIDDETGNIKIKLYGKTDWTPLEEVFAQDKTSNLIIHGNRIIKEPFLVLDIDKDNNTITYVNHRNERRHKFLYPDQKDTYAVFELDKGSYIEGKNLISATVNNTIVCNEQNYKLQELTSRRIGIDIDCLEAGCWLDVQYYDVNKMTQAGYEMYLNKDISKLKEKSFGVIYDKK